MTDDTATDKFTLPTYSKVAPFPLERFKFFLRKLKVQSKDYGLVPFQLLGSQVYILEEIIKGLEKGVTTFIILKARQLGSTTFFLALDMFWAFEHKGLLGAFILHKEDARDDWRAAIEVFYQEIPAKVEHNGHLVNFKPRKIAHNRNILSFKNGSRFRYLIAGTGENRKGGLGRSGAANYVHGTEVAFYGNEDDIRAFKSSTSSIYTHRLQIWETTANGFNHFWDTWEESKNSSTRKAIFVGWWRDERNAFSTDHEFFRAYMPEGPRSPLTIVERQRVKAVKALYDYTISVQQIAWYRWKLQDEFESDQSMMDQEFPWTEEDAFQATGSKYFEVESLTDAMREAKRLPFKPYRYKLTRRWEETVVVGVSDPRAELRIWEGASKFGYYVLGCDPAYGSSDDADRTVISVWRCYADQLVQVAEFCTPNVSTYQCAWVLAHLAGYYGANESHVILEISGPGTAVFEELKQLRMYTSNLRPGGENEELRNVLKNMRDFLYRKADTVAGGDLAFQWRMTEDLKRAIMAKFKDRFELGGMIVRSVPLLEEMRRIVNNDGYIAAEGRHKDDRVIAAALANQAWSQWVQQRLKAQNMTLARANVIEERGGPQPIDQLVVNYLKKVGISVQTK